MLISRRSLLALGAAASAVPLVGLPAFARTASGNLVVGLSAYPSNFNPFLDVGAAAAFVQQTLHRGLLGYTPEGELRGELAESWKNVEPTVWEFKLRDARFSNGRKVTPADIEWTLKQIAADASTAVLKNQMKQIVKFEAIDDKTIRLTTAAPVAVLPLWFANYYLPILPADTADVTAAVGAGPFVLKQAERGQFIEIAASEHFYRPGEPRLKTVRFTVYADENLRTAALIAGDVDLIDFVPWQSMGQVEGDPKLKLDATSGLFMYLMFNFDSRPFQDPRVRKAVALAMRRQEFIDAAFYGRGEVLDGFPAAPGTPFVDEAYLHAWAYDQAKAKALLAEAGYPNGFSCKLLSTAQYSMHQNTALVAQQHLAEIGITVELVLPDWATRGEMGTKGQYDMAVQGTGWRNGDPENWAVLLDGSQGNSVVRSWNMKNEQVSRLFADGLKELDPGKRKTIYDEIQKITVAETPFVPLLWRSQGYGMKKTVSGFKNMRGPLTQYSGVTLEATAAG